MAKPYLYMAGDIEIREDDPGLIDGRRPPNLVEVPMALVIRFPDAESIREAMATGKVEFDRFRSEG